MKRLTNYDKPSPGPCQGNVHLVLVIHEAQVLSQPSSARFGFNLPAWQRSHIWPYHIVPFTPWLKRWKNATIPKHCICIGLWSMRCGWGGGATSCKNQVEIGQRFGHDLFFLLVKIFCWVVTCIISCTPTPIQE